MAQGEGRGQLQDRRDDESGPINEQQIGAEFAKAFQELARGEQHATSLEGRLDDIESRIEALLASAEENARQATALKTESDTADEASARARPK